MTVPDSYTLSPRWTTRHRQEPRSIVRRDCRWRVSGGPNALIGCANHVTTIGCNRVAVGREMTPLKVIYKIENNYRETYCACRSRRYFSATNCCGALLRSLFRLTSDARALSTTPLCSCEPNRSSVPWRLEAWSLSSSCDSNMPSFERNCSFRAFWKLEGDAPGDEFILPKSCLNCA